MRAWMMMLLPVLAACQPVDPPANQGDGVWRGVLSSAKTHESLQTLALDGLALTAGLDSRRGHSAQWQVEQGRVRGLLAYRDSLGEHAIDYQLQGELLPRDRLEASLNGAAQPAELSLFYDAAQSDIAASYAMLAGQYLDDGGDLAISLSIAPDGAVEAYDAAGCVYLGFLDVVDPTLNVYAVSLDVDGCELAGEYIYGLASLDDTRPGRPRLSLPVWLTHSDRVEVWDFDRV